jgi:hypothetical protein
LGLLCRLRHAAGRPATLFPLDDVNISQPFASKAFKLAHVSSKGWLIGVTTGIGIKDIGLAFNHG